MENIVLEKNLDVILKQRNFLLVACVVLVISVFILSVYLIKQERVTVIVPSKITNVYEVGEGRVNAAYLEDFSKEVVMSFFNVSPGNIDFAIEEILKMVDPEYYGVLSKELLSIAEDINRRKVSTSFYPKEMEIDEQRLEVKVTGMLYTYVGKRRTSSDLKSYLIKYRYSLGNLLITEFYEVQDE